MAHFEITNDALRDMWTKGHSVVGIAAELKCHENTVRYRLKLMGLGNRRKETGKTEQPKTPPHTAAVRMPATPPSADPALMAAIARAKASRGPVVALGQVAARFRLPVAVVQGLAGRVG